jgi:hypothetical protein
METTQMIGSQNRVAEYFSGTGQHIKSMMDKVDHIIEGLLVVLTWMTCLILNFVVTEGARMFFWRYVT